MTMGTEMERAMRWDKIAGNTPVPNQDLTHPYVRLSADLIDEEVNGVEELLDSFRKGNLLGVIDGVGDGLKVICQLCFALGISPDQILGVVNDSNFSKFCYNKEDAEASVLSYENDVRYKNVFYEKVGDFYVIKGWKVSQDPTTDTPKILKGIHYVEPYLEGFVK